MPAALVAPAACMAAIPRDPLGSEAFASAPDTPSTGPIATPDFLPTMSAYDRAPTVRQYFGAADLRRPLLRCPLNRWFWCVRSCGGAPTSGVAPQWTCRHPELQRWHLQLRVRARRERQARPRKRCWLDENACYLRDLARLITPTAVVAGRREPWCRSVATDCTAAVTRRRRAPAADPPSANFTDGPCKRPFLLLTETASDLHFH
jgi:hypothetical protein